MAGVTLFVGNLPHEVREQQLRALLERAGDIRSVSIPLDRLTGRSRGFALVEVASETEAREIVRQFNGYVLDTRRLRVEPVREPHAGYAPRYGVRPRIRGRPAVRPHRPERSPGR
jgi:RNA recognition motif-containing protein